MRFIHTADWHLGRLFHNRRLTEDQAFTLGGLLALVETVQADAVVIAGDVFDRAVPPPDAVRLLDSTIARLALDLGVAVVMIAGNHDGAARLEYLSELARRPRRTGTLRPFRIPPLLCQCAACPQRALDLPGPGERRAGSAARLLDRRRAPGGAESLRPRVFSR